MKLQKAKTIGKLSLLLMLTSCGMEVDVKDSEHKMESKSEVEVKDSEHKVTVSDSEHKVTVQTTLDKVLEICGIVSPNGEVVTYNDWTEEQQQCLGKLNTTGGLPNEQGSEHLQEELKDKLGELGGNES